VVINITSQKTRKKAPNNILVNQFLKVIHNYINRAKFHSLSKIADIEQSGT